MDTMGHSRKMLPVGTLTTLKVENNMGESLGKIEDLMIDVASGQIAYAVLSSGGALGRGEKLFAIPWAELKLDLERDEVLILDISKSSFPSLATSTLMSRGMGPTFLRRCSRSNSAIGYKAGGR
jgi:sporulation protein YlmC with PRC-barrel domain